MDSGVKSISGNEIDGRLWRLLKEAECHLDAVRLDAGNGNREFEAAQARVMALRSAGTELFSQEDPTLAETQALVCRKICALKIAGLSFFKTSSPEFLYWGDRTSLRIKDLELSPNGRCYSQIREVLKGTRIDILRTFLDRKMNPKAR